MRFARRSSRICAQRGTPRKAERAARNGVDFLHREIVASSAADVETAADARSRVLANRLFHETINAAANNPQALKVLAQSRVLAEALRLRFGYGGGRPDAVIAEHPALVDAVTDRDADRAGEIARRHCTAARDDPLSHFQ